MGRQSEPVEKLLALILYVGNYMNGGTVRGRADGFDLDTLSKVSKVKASQEGSLLDFIVNQLEKERHDVLRGMYVSGGEYESIHEARKYKITELQAEVKALSTQADGFLNLAAKAASAGDLENERDGLPERSTKVAACRQRLEDVATKFERLQEQYMGLLKWFQMDDRKSLPADEFLTVWDTFLSEVKKSLEVIERRRLQQQRQEAQQRRSNSIPPGIKRRNSMPSSLSPSPAGR